MGKIDIDSIKSYFSSQPVVRAWLFGFFARGEERKVREAVNNDRILIYERGA